jgi:thiosulfate dehydrogenase (quinone) large subunit
MSGRARFAPPPASDPAPGVRASWQQQPWAIRILRGFLGGTFLYAGLQKFLDPNFLHRGTPDFIGSQLQAFSRGSPLAPLLSALGHAPVLTGVGVALGETAVGIATLLGVAAATAAACGFAINLILFLSASWHVHPYFLGSDSIYAAAWAAYLVSVLEGRRTAGGTRRHGRHGADREELTRRQVLRGATVAAGAMLLSVTAGAAAGPVGTSAAELPANPDSRGQRSPPPHSPTSGAGSSPLGTPIAKLDGMPVGGAIGFQAPSGAPAILVRTGKEQVVAYSRVCTHAGCLVGYDQQAETIVCPCHGAAFDPRRGAQVIAGPAPTPLPRVRVAIDQATGEVVAES